MLGEICSSKLMESIIHIEKFVYSFLPSFQHTNSMMSIDRTIPSDSINLFRLMFPIDIPVQLCTIGRGESEEQPISVGGIDGSGFFNIEIDELSSRSFVHVNSSDSNRVSPSGKEVSFSVGPSFTPPTLGFNPIDNAPSPPPSFSFMIDRKSVV